MILLLLVNKYTSASRSFQISFSHLPDRDISSPLTDSIRFSISHQHPLAKLSHAHPSTQSSTADLTASSTSKPQPEKRSLVEKVLSKLFDGPPGTQSSKEAREMRDKWDEDTMDIPRTEAEEKARRLRMQKRADVVGGGDGVRTNDMQKEGWAGGNLALGHA